MARERMKRGSVGTRPRGGTWGPTVAGCVVALSAVGGQVVRLVEARQSGDAADAADVVLGAEIGVPLATALIVLGILSALYMHTSGRVRARRLRRRFPDRLVLPVTRPAAFDALRGSLLPSKQNKFTVGFTIVADRHQLELWGGLLHYRALAVVPWERVGAVAMKERPSDQQARKVWHFISITSADWPAPFECGLVTSARTFDPGAPRDVVAEAVDSLACMTR